MAGKRGGEIMSDAVVVHYCERWIEGGFDRVSLFLCLKKRLQLSGFKQASESGSQ